MLISKSWFIDSLLSSLYCDLFFKYSTFILESENHILKDQVNKLGHHSCLESKAPGTNFLAIGLEFSGHFPPCLDIAFLSSFILLFSVSLLGWNLTRIYFM